MAHVLNSEVSIYDPITRGTYGGVVEEIHKGHIEEVKVRLFTGVLTDFLRSSEVQAV